MKLNSLSLTSAEILTELLESKINSIYFSDCLRFTEICDQLTNLRFGNNDKTNFYKFFIKSEDYKNENLPLEIRLLSDLISRKRRDLIKQSQELEFRYYDVVTFLGNYLLLWPINEKLIKTLTEKYKYNPPSKNKVLRIAFALQMSSYLSKFKSGRLNKIELNNYENMAKKIISDFSVVLKKYKLAWEKMLISY